MCNFALNNFTAHRLQCFFQNSKVPSQYLLQQKFTCSWYPQALALEIWGQSRKNPTSVLHWTTLSCIGYRTLSYMTGFISHCVKQQLFHTKFCETKTFCNVLHIYMQGSWKIEVNRANLQVISFESSNSTHLHSMLWTRNNTKLVSNVQIPMQPGAGVKSRAFSKSSLFKLLKWDGQQ